MSANRLLGIATWTIGNVTYRALLMTFVPIFISLSFRLVRDQPLIGSGVASVRRELPRW
jgi:hypothetical protein